MDEALFLVLEQISGILSGYVSGIRASKGISFQPQSPAPLEKREHKCRIVEFVPKNQLFNSYTKGVDHSLSLKTESVYTSDEGEDMKPKPVLRKDGRWQLYVKDVYGKKHYVYARSEKECRHKRAELEKAIARLPQKAQSGIHSRMTLHDFGVYYVKNFKKSEVDNRTYKQYLSIMENHLNCKISLFKLKVEDVQALVNSLPLTSLRDKVFSLLVQILKKAYAMDLIRKHIADLIEKGKTQTETLDALRVEDQKLLIENLDLESVFGKRVMFYLLTGARPAEIKTVSEIKKGYVHICGTKTKRADRWIHLSEKASELFANEKSDFFNFDLKRFRQRLQKYVEQYCGITSYVTIYTLRHTFATNLYYLKCPDKERAQYMGHTTTKTTNDFYTSLDPTISAIDIRNIYGDFYPEF